MLLASVSESASRSTIHLTTNLQSHQSLKATGLSQTEIESFCSVGVSGGDPGDLRRGSQPGSLGEVFVGFAGVST